MLAALIGGFFVLANTINRRVERLKNLAEVQVKGQKWLQSNYTLFLIIVRELYAIAYATTPELKWSRRFRYASYTCIGVFYVVFVLFSVHLISPILALSLAIAATALMVVFTIAFRFTHRKRLAYLDDVRKWEKAIYRRMNADETTESTGGTDDSEETEPEQAS